MDINTAQQAGGIVAAINQLQPLVDQINAAVIEGGWILTRMIITSPDGKRSIELLPAGVVANADNSALALTTAQSTFQSQLDALNKQLAGL